MLKAWTENIALEHEHEGVKKGAKITRTGYIILLYYTCT